jgi:hypothetical protein
VARSGSARANELSDVEAWASVEVGYADSARQRKDVCEDVVCFIGICLSVLASVRVRLRPSGQSS